MTETGFHLRGVYAPVTEELTAFDLPVTGAVPPELTGWYLRNGPNPRADSAHWFLGEGMIHGVRLEDGRAAWYRNRWVRTRSFTGEATLVREDGSFDLTASLANTHVIHHAGRTLALVESSLPYEVTRELDTVGPYDFDGALRTPMTAHPKLCPETGELHFFGYSPGPPYLTYHRANARGELELSRPVDVPGPTMMHDFTLTSRHVVFLDLPVVFDPAANAGMPYRWDPGYAARIGVLSRLDPHGPVRWFPVDPCYVFHTLNAYEAGDRIVLYVVRYPHLWWAGHEDAPSTLWRWTVDLATGTVTEDQLDDRPCEFPRIDDRLAGQDVRYGHVTAGDTLVRYDLHAGGSQAHTFAAGRIPGEAVFAPPNWLLTYVHDETRGTSDLVILDANDLRTPVAAVHLPGRVPAGFHGSWIAG
ncbi:carotenoid oxygenase family protein [Amycolatopsis cynarae]|uniref:Dioxygenase n=1 Tax=Amycolatopsis cynarae TaxID=2995223 RepID=A0ABY7B5A4_9PSEU|nr:carotenoid oxygenase family protein [Amycolatopsis sp. HUAS 11-8]WAL67504.1 carotenoid oxygenase family protein [Amycolatopsis sp. HUAS 11-8]